MYSAAKSIWNSDRMYMRNYFMFMFIFILNGYAFAGYEEYVSNSSSRSAYSNCLSYAQSIADSTSYYYRCADVDDTARFSYQVYTVLKGRQDTDQNRNFQTRKSFIYEEKINKETQSKNSAKASCQSSWVNPLDPELHACVDTPIISNFNGNMTYSNYSRCVHSSSAKTYTPLYSNGGRSTCSFSYSSEKDAENPEAPSLFFLWMKEGAHVMYKSSLSHLYAYSWDSDVGQVSDKIKWYTNGVHKLTGGGISLNQLGLRAGKNTVRIEVVGLNGAKNTKSKIIEYTDIPAVITISKPVITPGEILTVYRGDTIEFDGNVMFNGVNRNQDAEWFSYEKKLGKTSGLSYTFDDEYYPVNNRSYRISLVLNVSGHKFKKTFSIFLSSDLGTRIITPSPEKSFSQGETFSVKAITTHRGVATTDNSAIIEWTGDNVISSSGGVAVIDAKTPGSYRLRARALKDGEYTGYSSFRYTVSNDHSDENLADEGKCEGQSFAGNPINLQTGNKVQRELDYLSNGKFPLMVQRVYNSKSTSSGLFGASWSSNLEQSITLENNNQTAVLKKMSGAVERFNLVNSLWVSGRPSQVSRNTLTQVNESWVYTIKNGNIETYNNQGNITSIQTVNGYKQSYNYSNGQLISIVDDTNRTLTFAYENGLIKTVTTPDDVTYTYGYSSVSSSEYKNLASITYPLIEIDGQPISTSKNYLYQDSVFVHALTGIQNETGARFASWEYDSMGRAIYSGHGEGSIDKNGFEDLHIEFLSDNQTRITNSFAKTTTYNFQSIDGILKTTSIEGHASSNCDSAGKSNSYYPENGWIKDSTDFNGNITAYSYNSRGLITSVKVYGKNKLNTDGTYAGLTPDYQDSTVWHPILPKPSIVTKPGLTTNYDYYANGLIKDITQASTVPLTAENNLQAAFSSRIWHYDYTYYSSSKRIHTKTIDGPRKDVFDITTETYDGNGNLTSTKNAVNQQIVFGQSRSDSEYDWVINKNNIRSDVYYNSRGWPVKSETSTTSGEKINTKTYAYYKNGLLENTTNANGNSESYEYNSAHYLTARQNSVGERLEIGSHKDGGWKSKIIKNVQGEIVFQQKRNIDELGRTLNVQGANGQEVSYVYDANSNIKQQTLKRESDHNHSLVVDFEYDWFNRKTDTIPQTNIERSAKTHYDYRYGQIISISREALGNRPQDIVKTDYLYNGFGDLLKEASPDRGNRFYHYNLNSSLLTGIVDGRGISETRNYDALNRLTNKVFADASENVQYQYDQVIAGAFNIGNLTTVIDEIGTARYDYNILGKIKDKNYQVEEHNYSVSYLYNNDELEGMIYPSGRTISMTHDQQGRINSINENKNDSTQTLASDIQYLPFGPMKHIAYGNGISDTFSYDQSYRLTTNGQWGEYRYNFANQVSYALGSMAHEGGIQYKYDQQGRLYSANWPITESSVIDSGEVSTQYDHGAASGAVDSMSYSYDYFGNLTDRSYKGADMHSYPILGSGAPDWSRNYTLNTWAVASQNMQLEAGSHRLSSSSFEDYRLASEDTASPNVAIPSTHTSYQYNDAGSLISRAREGRGVVVDGFHNETLNYNDAGRLSDVIQDGNEVSSYQYNAQGQRVIVSKDGSSIIYHYDLEGQLIAETTPAGDLLKEYVYINGKPLVVIDNQLRNDALQWYSNEDAVLTPQQAANLSADVGIKNSQKTTLDGDGSITLQLKENGHSARVGATEFGFALFDNQLNTSVSEPLIKISLVGHTQFIPITASEIMVPLIITLNQHLEFTDKQGQTTSISEQYSWIKLDRKGQDFTLYGSSDGDQWKKIVETYAAASAELTIKASAINAEMNIGQMNVVKTLDPTFYYHNDLVGTPKIMTNSKGTAVWKSDLAPYGERFENEFGVGNLDVADANSNLNLNLRFPGQYADNETGFNYNYFRDYDPSTGRYIQSDPIGLRGGLNMYGYALGDPVNNTDPRGLYVPQLVGGAVGFLVGFGLEFSSDNGDIWSAGLAGLSGGAAGALSGGLSVAYSLGIAGAATATNEVYKSYRDCGDLSNFSSLNVGVSVVGTYLGGKVVAPATKLLARIKVPGPGNSVQPLIPNGRMVLAPLQDGKPSQLLSLNHEILRSGSAAFFEGLSPYLISDGLSSFGSNE